MKAVKLGLVLFLVLCMAIVVSSAMTENSGELTQAKISEDVRDAVKSSNEVHLILHLKEPEGVMSVHESVPRELIAEMNEISKLARTVRAMQKELEEGKSVDEQDLQQKLSTFKEKERKISTKMDGIRQKVIENNKALIGKEVERVSEKLKEIDGVEVTETYDLIPVIAVKAKKDSIPLIAEIPEVTKITLDVDLTSDLDVSIPTINADDVWSYGDTGSGVKVAVEDTGISGNSNLVVSDSYSAVPGEGTNDLNGHGTRVAGVVASKHSTWKGVSYNVYLMNAKCRNKYGSGKLSWLEAATNWAINRGASIISHSGTNKNKADDGNSDLSKFVDYIVDRYDVIWVNSIGNDQPSPRAPGGTYNAIGVGASNDKNTASRSDDSMASFSPPGPTSDNRKKPDVSAPGENIHTTTKNNGFADVDGTSFSTPHVSGIAALIKEDRPSINSLLAKAIIINSAEKRGFDSWNSKWGWGYVDANRAWWDDYKTFVGTIGNGGSVYLHFYAYSGDEITTTLVWNRHMTDSTTVKGYSDLDLYVFDPNGYLVGSSYDSNDNVEQVHFTASKTGQYTVKVYGFRVPSSVGQETFVVASSEYLNY